MQRGNALGRELASRLSEGGYRLETSEGEGGPLSAFTLRQAAQTCDRLLVLVARDAGRLPGSLIRDTLGEFTSELCENTWNVTPLVIQPALHNEKLVEFDAETTSALAGHIMQELVLGDARVEVGPALTRGAR